jgi:peptidyl-prolyl cis-trans isomerase B (cyclophilin B)
VTSIPRRLWQRAATLATVIGLASLGGAFGIAPLGGALPAAAQGAAAKGGKPVVTLTTSLGVIELELDPEKAPITVENFLGYVDAGFYDGTIFHRVIPGFMIQGGGFDAAFVQKPTKAQIKNEATNGLTNKRGTVAMARTNVVDSATAQFFINLKDNDFLNHSSPDPRGYGYAVFGRVTKGMDVVDKIAAVATGQRGPHGDVPKQNVVIESAKRKK